MVTSLASVHDAHDGARHRVLYRSIVSELIVPYLDPEDGWYFHTFMDAGEFNLGIITEVRPDVTLVVRMVVTVGNYDYILDREFKTTDTIKFMV
ncbi:hypothetical protein PR202_ga30448 [Eleusine coracana subsp. coracana]|uniref:Amine oxidase n=1 Tax=Eleusine coracana subsp. coracana TaxID=191504 RepID=A0AAV5DPQ0_ELECO|nr:hypothetical protein PR202_ga30448 [Eleusine coracana subsp. coracana]